MESQLQIKEEKIDVNEYDLSLIAKYDNTIENTELSQVRIKEEKLVDYGNNLLQWWPLEILRPKRFLLSTSNQ